MKKPSRRDLVKVIGKLQCLIGSAIGLHWDDKDPDGFEKAQEKLKEAHELCIEALQHDPPQLLDSDEDPATEWCG